MTPLGSHREPTGAVVVGGGLAGMTAAYLARAGGVATLLEKAARLGGRVTTEARQGSASTAESARSTPAARPREALPHAAQPP